MLNKNFKHFCVGSLLALAFVWPQSIFATAPPTLLSPSNNSLVEKSPKLNWEYTGGCVESGSCFRVQVDNSPDFSSPEKSTYTNNYSYSPQSLVQGIWNWRVKAKDKSENWSDWSKVFEFTITSQTPAPSPSQSSQTPQTPQSSSNPQKNQAAFEIKGVPSEIKSMEEFETQVFLTLPNNPDQNFFLKGAFKKDGSSNYFGKTYSEGWVGNSEKYSRQLKITTDSKGDWEGKIKTMPDPQDQGFQGSGNYIFKVARYSDSGSGPAWSNEVSIKINEALNPSPSEDPATETEFIKEEEETDITASLVREDPKIHEIRIASVAGESVIVNNTTVQEQTRVTGQKQVNWMLVILGIGVLASGSGFIIYKLKKEKLNAKSFN